MRASIAQPAKRILIFLTGLVVFISGCLPKPAATSPPFRAPTAPNSGTPASGVPGFTVLPQPTLLDLAIGTPTEGFPALPGPTSTCLSSLRFVQDVNYPDNTPVQPGQQIPKVWMVENNGTCDWDSRYSLRFLSGLPMGAGSDQALYPARAGTQAELQIGFTAPDTPGTYRSEWSAYDPNGNAFGDVLYVQITVGTP